MNWANNLESIQLCCKSREIAGCPDYFDLDDHHRFFTDEPMSVCSNSCSMVADTRYGAHFKVDGSLRHHYGAFGKCGNVERIVEG